MGQVLFSRTMGVGTLKEPRNEGIMRAWMQREKVRRRRNNGGEVDRPTAAQCPPKAVPPPAVMKRAAVVLQKGSQLQWEGERRGDESARKATDLLAFVRQVLRDVKANSVDAPRPLLATQRTFARGELI